MTINGVWSPARPLDQTPGHGPNGLRRFPESDLWPVQQGFMSASRATVNSLCSMLEFRNQRKIRNVKHYSDLGLPWG
jgi:hypothetical protein